MNAVSRRASSIDVITPPTGEPVDLVLARLHLRLDAAGAPPTHPDDALVSLWLASAREECERYTNRRFMAQTVRMGFAGGVGALGLELPLGPVASIATVEAVAADGSATPAPSTDYIPVLGLSPARLLPVTGAAWSTAPGCRVTAVVGYASAAEVPAPLKAAILLLVGQAYELRESGIEATWGDAMPVAVARLLAPFRIWLF